MRPKVRSTLTYQDKNLKSGGLHFLNVLGRTLGFRAIDYLPRAH